MFGNVNKDSHRAGNYVQQPAGYKAFIPQPLPPQPPLHLDDEMLSLLSKADIALGRLDGATETLPNPNLFVAMYVRKEAVLSSQIEGTQASLEDVLEYESEATELPNIQDITEVVNYVTALNYGLERLETFPMSLRLLREIHKRLLAGVRRANRAPGEFRSSQNFIGRSSDAHIESATFVPPPPLQMLQALDDFEKFLHIRHEMPALLKAGLLHAQFETIHPFLDGNGRMGRLLISFYLCQQNILRRPLLYLSYFFKKHREQYYTLLQKIRDQGDWESWMTFFLQGTNEVANDATTKARKIVRIREKHRNTIIERCGRSVGSALKLFEGLYERPVITIKQASAITELAYTNANRLVTQFEEMGILQKMGQNERNRRFRYRPYIDILEEDEEGSPGFPSREDDDHTMFE